MNKTITALTVQKKNKERVSIFLDGEFAFGVSLSIAERLRKDQVLTSAEIEQLQSDEQYSKAYNAAVRYLSYRQRTQQEMTRYLTQKEYPDEVVTTTLERLLEYRYLDDEEFARSWLSDRTRLRPRSARALRYELRQKGVANDILDDVLQELDEEEAAWNAVQSKLDRWRALDEWPFQQKVSAFLGRRGFGYDVVRSVIERSKYHDDEIGS